MEGVKKIDVEFDDVMREIVVEGNEDGRWWIEDVE